MPGTRRFESILDGSSRSVTSTIARAALWVASQPYGAAIRLRNRLYDARWLGSQSVELPVISVGNLTAGGTGKTPACAMIARWFRDRSVRVAILSRGYAALEDGANDEARELEAMLPDVPHLQSPNRIEIAGTARDELGMQLLVLDDGFQHRKISRNLDIVLLDATEPFGFGHLLPRGLLREPVHGLRRADMVIATRSDQVDRQRLSDLRNFVQRYNPRAAWIESIHAPVSLVSWDGVPQPLEWLRGKRVLAVSAIGNPRGFEKTLASLGAEIVGHETYPDHHPYARTDIERLESIVLQSDRPMDAVICTGKDLSKLELSAIGAAPLYALQISMHIQAGKDILEEHLERVLQRVAHDATGTSEPIPDA